MSYKPSWDSGNWLAICDRCGLKFKASQLQETWDGFMVCVGDWEERQPQDFVAGVPDQQALPWTSVEQEDNSLDSDGYIFPYGYFTEDGIDNIPDNLPTNGAGFNRTLTLNSGGTGYTDSGAMKDVAPDVENIPPTDDWYILRETAPSITYSNNDTA